MTIDGLVGSVLTVALTNDIKRNMKITFNSTPSDNQYQDLLVDLIDFLQHNVAGGITAKETGGRSAYGLPDYEFKRKTQPTNGYQMRGDYINAVRISPLSITDEQILTMYADHLRKELNLTD